MDTATKERTMSATAETTISETSTEWYDWRERITEALRDGTALSPLVIFEQLALRSKKEKRCAECGDAGCVAVAPSAYNHVPYFLCDECDAYYAGHTGGNTYTVLRRDGKYWVQVESLSNRRNAQRIARSVNGETRVRRNG